VVDEKLTFVHLSDIHFILGFSNESPFDTDKPVRDAILQDAKTLRKKLTSANGKLAPTQLALQVYNELLLLRALGTKEA
jgi:hypothetical protein